MIRRKEELISVPKKIKGGVGQVFITELLRSDEFSNKGRLFAKILVKPGDSIGKHMHSGDFEAYYILEGKGKYIENGEEKVVNKGDFTLTRDGEEHELINNGEKDLELIALVLYSK